MDYRTLGHRGTAVTSGQMTNRSSGHRTCDDAALPRLDLTTPMIGNATPGVPPGLQPESGGKAGSNFAGNELGSVVDVYFLGRALDPALAT